MTSPYSGGLSVIDVINEDIQRGTVYDVLASAIAKSQGQQLSNTTDFVLQIDLSDQIDAAFLADIEATKKKLRDREKTKPPVPMGTKLYKKLTGRSLTTEEAVAALDEMASGPYRTNAFALGNLVTKIQSANQPIGGRRKTSKIGEKFNRCVKSVRQTVRARPKSTKESAAIAICTKSVLQTRGRTMKRYRKKRLITQKKFRGGCPATDGMSCS